MKSYRVILLCFIPLGLSLIIAFSISQTWLPNHVFIAQYSIDSIALITRLGIFTTLLAFGAWGFFRWHTQQLKTATNAITQQSTKDHKLFIQRLDHEIKNPLTIMQLGLVNMLDKKSLPDDDRHTLERMQTQLNRLRQLVMDLRSLTELEDRMVERSQIDLEIVLQNTIDSLVPDHARQIELSVQRVPWPVGSIIGDTDLLTIAFTNLLNNALKFTPDDGSIRLQIIDNGQQAIIEVADNGIGIPQSEVSRIFDELYRASNAARVSGSGMGLALVHRIVSLHHGDVNIRSREGHGTSITVQLPLANKR